MSFKVLVLGRDSNSTRVLISELLKSSNEVIWIEEKRDDKFKLIRNRLNKKGLLTVLAQAVFLLYMKILFLTSKKRINALLKDFDLNYKISPFKTYSNLNDSKFHSLLKYCEFDLVILSGTRILNNHTLNCIQKPVVNIHAGITPRYRGVHGGYWALVNNDERNFGSTIHYVDSGIDTGEVISYCYSKLSSSDNFLTYPLLQQISAVKCINSLLPKIVNRTDFKVKCVKGSYLRTHPTIFEYFRNGVK